MMTERQPKKPRQYIGGALWREWPEVPDGMHEPAKIGGFSFHTYDPTWAKLIATEMWGPYGTTWGLRNLRWGYIGADNAKPDELFLEAEFFWPGGAFEISSDIEWRRAGDNRKKLQTDTLKKALSYLGLASEIYLGKYDGDKYSNPTPSPGGDTADKAIEAIMAAADDVTVDKYVNAARTRGLNSYNLNRVIQAGKDRKSELEQEGVFGGEDEES